MEVTVNVMTLGEEIVVTTNFLCAFVVFLSIISRTIFFLFHFVFFYNVKATSSTNDNLILQKKKMLGNF